MQKIRQGDQVQVIAGNDIGLQGEVKEIKHKWKINRKKERIKRDLNAMRVVVAGVKVVKKHQKPTTQNRQGGIIEFEAPIHLSNVMLICPSCDEPVRVGIRLVDDSKVRFCKRCDANID